MTEASGTPRPLNYAMDVAWPTSALSSPSVANITAVSGTANGADGTPDGSAYLLFGHVGFPVFGRSEDAEAFVRDTPGLPVTVQGAFFLQRSKAYELWIALGVHLGEIVPPPSEEQ